MPNEANNPGIQQLDFSVNCTKALLWQYQNATALQSLVNSKQAWYNENQEAFWTDWIRDVFDLRTANQFGLIVWGIILDLPLYVNNPPNSNAPTFGFNASNFMNFNRGNFQSVSGNSYQLPLATQRLALQLRYFQLCSSGTVPETNRFLNYAFSQYNGSAPGQVFLVDNHDMTQTYHFLSPMDAGLVYLLQNYDILPRPAGVKSTWINNSVSSFGFAPYGLSFNQGNFAS